MKKIIKYTFIPVFSGILILLILYFLDIINNIILYSTVYAAGLNLLNSIIAFSMFEKSIKKSNQAFLISNLGGMGIRMIFLLIVLFLSIKFLKIHMLSFILVFFIFYFSLLAMEVYYFKVRIEEKKKNNS